MAKYSEYKQVSFPAIAREILHFWEENKIFEKSVSERDGAPSFTFYEGPPSANGTPGIHHVMGRTVKDIFCRYKTQKGFQVKRKGGWDTHGLPVELQVEKELGIKKEDIGTTLSVEEYNHKCREAVMKYKHEWDTLTRLMGYWVDLEDPYITFERDYMESLWYLLKKFHEKGLLYKGYTIQPFSPAAGTGLSSHELNQPGTYKEVKDTTVVAQFKVKGTDNDYLLAWTTTPWTLPSNSALAVGEKIFYVKVKTFNPYTHKPVNVIMAYELLSSYFKTVNPVPEKHGELYRTHTVKGNTVTSMGKVEAYAPGDKFIPYEVTDCYTGKELEGMEYEQLLPYVQPGEPAFRVIPGDFVSTEDGTGIVHIAPTFGADDYRVARQAGIPAILVKDEQGTLGPLVDRQGRFVKEVTDFAGRYVKEEYYDEVTRTQPDFKPTDVLIAIKLKEENKAFRVEKYEHTYPHCWRTDKPVLYYPLDSWFIKTTALKDRLVELNKTINWKPASTGSGRFGNWLENLVDWNLSRSRFWGTPLPIWVTQDRQEEKCIGSLAELKEEVKKSVAAGLMNKEIDDAFDLHRPYVDEVVLMSTKGEPMYREPDLIDVWFDSGAMPYAQWHYPFENQDLFEKNYPADFIAEGVDQTRGWFFTLHAISVLLFDSVAFKNVIANGLVLDKNGNKMSKRLGNAINPFDTMEKYGPDATRWYMISNANPWDNLKFDLDGVQEVQRKFFGTLSNTYSFFALYANLDHFDFSGEVIPVGQRTESDAWIISRLNSLILQTDEAYSDYEPTKAARAIQDFVADDLSNWYVRLNRKRFWVGEYTDDKESAYQTLYTCLMTVARLAAPIAPFYAERLFHDLNSVTKMEKAASVHLADFPVSDPSLIDQELERRMELAQGVSSLVHSLRKREKIKVRQPLQKILVPVLSEKDKKRLSKVEELIISETNVKQVEYLDDESGVLIKKIKPNFRKLGQLYGQKMKALTPLISALDQEAIKTLEKEGSYPILLEDETIVISLDDVEISSEDIPGWLVASENGLTVALDVTISEELRKEGISRDVVNRLQNLRKDQGLDVQDKIGVSYFTKDEMAKLAINSFKDYIQKETQSLRMDFNEQLTEGTPLDIDGIELIVSLEVIK